MMFDYSLGSSIMAMILAGGVVVAHWRLSKRSRREQALLTEALEALRTECGAKFTAAEAANAEVEASLASTRSVLGDGRFSASRRAEALRLLRSGASPETTAKTLGMAKVETRLLASVYAALTSK
jgi:hypothetical protein